MATIQTRIFIVSDTHGQDFGGANIPELERSADVAIHCGDLTNDSKLTEFRTAISLLTHINAPLKLVIAGNHDFTLDDQAFKRIVGEASPPLAPDLVATEYGHPGEARQLMDEMAEAGIRFLDEGNHEFLLDNGALLKVYASPWTPGSGGWGFQYPASAKHEFAINDNTDIVITHGPPKGIMDYTSDQRRAGCSDLFQAIARARPFIHCFGHIHEGWGAKLVAWKEPMTDELNHFNSIDNDQSTVIENLASINPSRFDEFDELQKKAAKRERYSRDRLCATSYSNGGENPLRKEDYTLFVNAAIMDHDNRPTQKSFLVDIELAKVS
jgi:hypothetical protein